MGGFGSGMGIRYNTNRKKAFVQEYKSITSRMLPYKTMQKIPSHGVQVNLHGVDALVFPSHMEIRSVNGVKELSIDIPFAKSAVNYGNSRYWMQCPNPQCRRRCGKLYLFNLKGFSLFLCRICLNLAYKSQNETDLDRLISKKWALIRRLKSDSDIILKKPKWMQKKTFKRLLIELEELNIRISQGLVSKFGGYCPTF
ncbi:MAG: hypothetical protein JSR57_09350 [Verrucomicrobia bacterium]|nr:hypothetical protein [Verrucomicrobiota bacterium]